MVKVSKVAVSVLLAISPSVMAEAVPVTQFDQVVVSASRGEEQKAQDVPASMVVITEEKIEREQAASVADLVKYEPGVSVSGSGRFGGSSVNIRGIEGNRVKILIDGVDQPSEYDSGTEFMRAGRNFVDVDTLKRVEIIKSPASSLYGSDALGGVVAYTTKDPADYLGPDNRFGGSAKVAYHGDSETWSETLALAGRTGGLEALLQYTRRDGHELDNQGTQGGIGDERTQPNPLDISSDSLLGKLIYKGFEDHEIGLVADLYAEQNKSDLLTENDGAPGEEGVTYANQRSDDSADRLRLGLYHRIDKDTLLFDRLKWQLDWQQSETTQTTYNWYQYTGDRRLDRQYDEDRLGFTLDLHKSLTTGAISHTFSYGAEYEDRSLENHNTTTVYATGDVTESRYVPKADATSYGIYLQDEMVWGALRITPGVRYDNFRMTPNKDDLYHYPETFEDHKSDKVTWRLGALYQISDNVAVFGQYAQGFRAPDLKEMYYAEDSGRGYALLPNSELDPEQSDAYELGLRLSGSYGAMELVGFYNDYQDFIEQTVAYGDPAYPYGLFQYNNVAEATIKGAELSAELWLDAMGAPEGWVMNLAVAYADGEGKDDADSAERPLNSVNPWSSVIGLAYDHSSERWGGALNLTYSAAKDSDDIAPPTDFMGNPQEAFATDSYTVVDLLAYYKPMENLTLRAGVENLFDETYIQWQDVAGMEAGRSYMDRYTQPGRNFNVSVKFDF
ncbi:TonB-dependent hemoglobin/transferrin/lactoferrin family receptor [Ferrimonas balearica]|uniref:TonB-dependent hemoglobin/transferrin/lactoferrin family receptor n=1 Tax=Ferrimonas balearica TaxID=44012 RepID=UPI001C94EA63|nr:TonB-dependent hemoglobin/transferrin/lactoferrin family receptor [Ferrimonas balearica]MBY5979100.1 TonB-dependent hemoglobin/transferrin/lactoferrin family receptor [Ferrimonas balearica]